MSSRRNRSQYVGSRLLVEMLEERTMLTVTIDPLPSIYGGSISLPAAKSIVVPLTATNTLTGPVTWTVKSSTGTLVPLLNSIKPGVSATRTFLRFSTSMGDMDFQLFNDITPITTAYLLSHLTSPDYINTLFYRIFQTPNSQGLSIIQGGDRDNDGQSNTPGLAIQQEVDPRVLYDGHGQLGEARLEQPDTGSEAFFVTVDQQRAFDFRYSIYGQMVRGWSTLTALNSVATDGNGAPVSPPTLFGISVLNDQSDAVMTLVSTSLTPVSGTLTVTAKDAFGHSAVRVINVNTSTDTVDDPPFLQAPSVVNRVIPKNVQTAVSFGAATDIEGDAYTVVAQLAGSPAHYTASYNKTTLFITPDSGYTGPIQVVVLAGQASNPSTSYTGRTYTFLVDSGAAPTYSTHVTDVVGAAGASYFFKVTYTDDTLVNASTVIGNNSLVTVTGPGGIVLPAAYVAIDGAGNAGSKTVTYRVTAPGGSWNVADAGAYTVSVRGGVVKDTLGHAAGAAAIGKFYYSPTPFFDERYFLAMNPDVAAAVRAGTYTSGYQQFILFGQSQGRAASPYFSEKFYRQLNPAVDAAVRAGTFKSGWQHWTLYGARQGLVASAVFNEKQYLQLYPDVAAAVARKAINSGFEHFVLHGQFEGRNPSFYFDLNAYKALYPAVVAAVNAGQAGVAQTVTEHFILYGEKEGRHSDNLFNETYYLAQNPDVAAAVAAGQFRSGYEHFMLFGAKEKRNPSVDFNSAFYLATYPDVAAAVASGTFGSAFEHYIRFGMAEGRVGHA